MNTKNVILAFTIVLFMVLTATSVIMFSERHQHHVEKPIIESEVPPLPTTIKLPVVQSKPIQRQTEEVYPEIKPVIQWRDSQSRAFKVYNILGHHFLFVSEDGYLKTVTEFAVSTSFTPPAPPKQPVKDVDYNVLPPEPPKAEVIDVPDKF